jgi:small subunit ribosomal protein S16
MVTIRLARSGSKKRPFYHVHIAERREKRDGRYIERVGFYNPVATGGEQKLRLDSERIEHWLKLGAQPSDRVAALIKEWARTSSTEPVEAVETPAEPTGSEEAAETTTESTESEEA